MDDELGMDCKRILLNITYPRAGHDAVRQIRTLDEKINDYIIHDPNYILREQQKIYSRAERIQRNHNYRDRRNG